MACRSRLTGSKKQAALQAAGPAESESAGKIAQCHIVFGITGANWVTLSEPDQPRRTGDRFLGEAFAVASACLAAFARAERDSFSSRLSSSFNLWYCCEAAL